MGLTDDLNGTEQMTKNEVAEANSEVTINAPVVELGELQLALVGGGSGDVLWG